MFHTTCSPAERNRAWTSSIFSCDGGGIPHLVLHPQLFPLETAELMEWQHIHPFDIAQARGEICHLADFVEVVGPARHDDETHPDASSPRGETASKRVDGLRILAGEPHGEGPA